MHTQDEGTLVLIVNDDPAGANGLAALLRESGHRARVITDPRVASDLAETLEPDVIIVDAVMRHIDGLSLCVALRERVTSSILLLTAHDDPHDRTLALRLGADDSMAKPYDELEMDARVAALVRRRRRGPRPMPRQVGSLVIDTRAVRASIAGRPIDLTPTEFRVLDLLTTQPGRVFSREELLDLVFDRRLEQPTRAIDVHMGRLRRKLEGAGLRDVRIRARRGFGYAAVTPRQGANVQPVPALLPA